MTFTIKKNTDRYGEIDRNLPDEFTVEGLTEKQADEIADRLTNRNAGCDYAWYVVGGEADR